MMGTLFFNVKLIPWLDATTFLLPDDDTKKTVFPVKGGAKAPDGKPLTGKTAFWYRTVKAGMDGYSFMEKRKLTSILFLTISEKKYDKIGL